MTLTLAALALGLAQFRVNVNVIQVDVTVEDRAGKRVSDLNLNDFEVQVDGKKQKLTNVLWVPGRPAPASVPVTTTNVPAPKMRPQDARRTIALVLDDLSVSNVNLVAARKAMREFIEQKMGPGDLVGFFRTSRSMGLMQQFTTDKQALLAQIDNTRVAGWNVLDPLAAINNNPAEDSGDPTLAEMAQAQRLREEVFLRQRQDAITAGMMNTLQVIANGLRDLPGRKSMVVLSEAMQLYDAPQSMTNPDMTSSMQMSPGAMGGARERTAEAMRRLINMANRSGVVMYTIDPRGVVYNGLTAADQPSGNVRRMQGQILQRQMVLTQSQDGMMELADQTGGMFFRNTNDLGQAIAAAFDDLDGYYIVSFAPEDDTFEKSKGAAKYHNLSVKLKRSGLKVRYRHGFLGQTDEEAEAKTTPLTRALLSPFVAVDVPVKLTPIFLADAALKPALRALLHIEADNFTFTDTPDGKQAEVDYLIALFDSYGMQVAQQAQRFMVKVPAAGLDRLKSRGINHEFMLPLVKSGIYQMRVAVVDVASGRAGSAMEFVDVADLASKNLAMSDIGFTCETGASVRVVRGGEKIEYAALLFHPKVAKGGTTPNLETQVILYRDGKAVYTGKKMPFQPGDYKDGQPVAITGAMTLGANTKAGNYVLQLTVKDNEAPKGRQLVQRSIDFEMR